jgi:hypothetical protein
VRNSNSFSVADGINLALVICWVLMIVVLGIAGALQEVQTAIIVIAIFWLVFLMVTDVVLVANKDVIGDTWSERLRHWGLHFTSMPVWIFGVCAGRWFHPFDAGTKIIQSDGLAYSLLAGLTVAVLVVGIVLWKKGLMRFTPPWAVLILAIASGVILAPAAFPEL